MNAAPENENEYDYSWKCDRDGYGENAGCWCDWICADLDRGVQHRELITRETVNPKKRKKTTVNTIKTNGQTLLMTANEQWRNRPNDERYETLEALKKAVEARQCNSYQVDVATREISYEVRNEKLTARIRGESFVANNWSFSQLAGLADAPAGYLRKLSSSLAAECLNEGMAKREAETIKLLVEAEPYEKAQSLRAATSSSYGRIWDSQVVGAAERIVEKSGGKFYNPKEWSGKGSGLYASDRDVFIFLIDGGSMVDGGGERDQLNRGIILWNSEVGKCIFGMQTFLFRQVCGNHIIWGAQELREIKVRHTSGGPERFEREAMPEIKRYIDASTESTRAGILRAKGILLPKREELITSKFANNFTRGEMIDSIDAAEREEGKCENLWELVQGMTAAARSSKWLDSRVDLERRAGKLLASALK